MTQGDLAQLHDFSLQACDMDRLTDIRTVRIDRSQPVPRRIRDFVDAVGNPYLFKVGPVAVKISFDPKGKPFQTALADAVNGLWTE